MGCWWRSPLGAFAVLDEWGAEAMDHREIARKVAAELGIDPLVWNAQAVTTSYERAKGRRAVRSDGFAAPVSRTIAAPLDVVFAALADDDRRQALKARWSTALDALEARLERGATDA